MLPPKTFKHLVFINKMGWILGSVPYRFLKDPVTGQKNLVPSFTKYRIFYVHGTFTCIMGYLSYLILRLMHTILFKDYNTKFVVQMCYQFFGYAQVAVIHFTTLHMLREIPQFLISTRRQFKLMTDRYIIPGHWGPKCLKFFYVWYFVCFVVNSQNCVLIIKKPYREHYLTSLFEDPKNTPILHRLPFMMIHFVVWFSGWMQVLTMCFHLYTYMSSLVWIIREMDINISSPNTKESLRETKNFSREIRSLQVLHSMWLHANQSFFCPAHKLVAILVATLGTYGAIKLSVPTSILMGCMATISTLYVWCLFSKFGQLHMVSKDVLDNWMNSPKSPKWLKKQVKSVPVFCVKIGSFYRVERMTVFTALEAILDNTITLLFL